MKFDLGSRLCELKGYPLFYYILTGLSYTEIANKYYYRNKNKVIYAIRKLCKEFDLKNRRQLAYFAIAHELVNMERVIVYMPECNT